MSNFEERNTEHEIELSRFNKYQYRKGRMTKLNETKSFGGPDHRTMKQYLDIKQQNERYLPDINVSFQEYDRWIAFDLKTSLNPDKKNIQIELAAIEVARRTGRVIVAKINGKYAYIVPDELYSLWDIIYLRPWRWNKKDKQLIHHTFPGKSVKFEDGRGSGTPFVKIYKSKFHKILKFNHQKSQRTLYNF